MGVNWKNERRHGGKPRHARYGTHREQIVNGYTITCGKSWGIVRHGGKVVHEEKGFNRRQRCEAWAAKQPKGNDRDERTPLL